MSEPDFDTVEDMLQSQTELCNDRAEWHRKRIRAMQLIESGSVTAHDVAANHCQILGNVAHMDWFINEVAEEVA